jgi:hypothetical protein
MSKKRKKAVRIFLVNCSNGCGEKVSVKAREYPEHEVTCRDCLSQYQDACKRVVDDCYDD